MTCRCESFDGHVEKEVLVTITFWELKFIYSKLQCSQPSHMMTSGGTLLVYLGDPRATVGYF